MTFFTREKQLGHYFIAYLYNFIILLQKTLQHIYRHLMQRGGKKETEMRYEMIFLKKNISE